MKHLKRKTKIAIAIILLLIVLSVLAYRCGLRIVYAPELDNNWNAISGVAAWFSVIASSVAVWYAVRVADKQNKIALFEKRYELFNFVDRCEIFASTLNNRKDNTRVRHLFLACFFDVLQQDKANDNDFFLPKIGGCFDKIRQTDFLFKNTDIQLLMGELSTTVYDIVQSALSIEDDPKASKELDGNIKKLITFVNGNKYKKLVSKMKEELMLK